MGGKNVKTCNGFYVQVYILRPVIHTARPCVARSNVTVRCQSVCLFQHGPTTANPLLQVAAEPGGQEISIDCNMARALQQRLANVGSATLSAYVEAEHQPCFS